MINLKRITAIYGPSGSGKTILSIQSLMPMLKENKKIIYLDTEGKLSLEKIKNISNNNLENLFVFNIKNFKEQQLKINNLKDIKNASLIVIDSINNHYRTLVKSKPDLANAMLKSQLRTLKSLKIPIIITNQVYTDTNTGKTKVTGGYIIQDFCDEIIELKKEPRKMIIKSKKEESFIKINEKGIEKILS